MAGVRLGRAGGIATKNLFLLSLIIFLAPGCSTDKDLERLNKTQAATIQSLNREIERLNQEMDQVLRAREDLMKTKVEMEKKLPEELASGDLSLSIEARGLVVTVLDRVLFDSGKAELKPSSEATLEKVADILNHKAKAYMIYVEGHTDNQPIRHSGWRSNWELSTARATEVIHYFADHGRLSPRAVAAVGYGEFHPVVGNETTEGRMKNRRVEIVISPKKWGDKGGASP